MRIVGGKWRGRKLAELGAGDEAARLRPSSDRLRESLFNILRHEKFGHAPQSMRVLDLFAGSGALAFEALSRGAEFACMVDQGAVARRLIKENAANLGCQDRAQFLTADATRLGECGQTSFNLVFLDPPYGKALGEKAVDSAFQGGWLAQDSVIVWEEEVAPTLPKFLQLLDQRKIGRAVLTIARLKEA